MDNAEVIGLTAAGMSDDIVTAKIHAAASTAFDTSVDGLKALKIANVPASVIKAMIDPRNTSSATSLPVSNTAFSNAVFDSDDPMVAHSPGIYIRLLGRDRIPHLNKLEHTVPKQEKTSGTFLSGITYGITKAHVKVVLDGTAASVESDDANPTFYVYIPEDNSTFGGSSISIKDFALMKFDVKSNQRELNTANLSMWGASAGADEKSRQGFTSDQVKPGIYKLTLLKPLPTGEYAFQQSGGQGSSQTQQNTGAYFDFGISGSR